MSIHTDSRESKEPRPQGGALKPKTEIPNQVRDDKKTRTQSCCHAEPGPEFNSGSKDFSIWFAIFCFWQTHLSSPSTGRGFQVRS